MSDPQRLREGFNPRTIFPSEPAIKLSARMQELSKPARVSQRWMAAKVEKLIPMAVQLEQNQVAYAVGAGTIGAILGLFVGISIGD